ncbi:bifunctional nuclease 2-like protein, partial [Tanacetum coccineum]
SNKEYEFYGIVNNTLILPYGDDGNVRGHVKYGAKSCWLNIVRETHELKTKGINLLDCMHVKLGNGDKTIFWEDILIDGKTLKNRFPFIYSLESCKLITVGAKLAQPSLEYSFRRNPRGGVEQDQFNELSALVHHVSLIPMSNKWKWDLESSGDFSVASVRKIIDDKSLSDVDSKTRWIKYVPIKVNVHAWKVKTNSFPTRLNVSIMCAICDNGVETSRHLFFYCCMVRQIIHKITRWWDVPYVDVESYEDWYNWLVNLRISSMHKQMFQGVFYVMWWHLWSFRIDVMRRLVGMSSLQGPAVCPSVPRKQGGVHRVPVVNGCLSKAKSLRSEMWGIRGVYSRRIRIPSQPRSKTVTCTFSSSSNGNGSMAESFNENDSNYVDSSVVEAVEVKSGPEGFMIKMRDGRHLRCAHNNPQGGHLPDYAPHPAIVLKMEDGTGLLLPIIVLEMPSVLLMAAIRNVQIARPTMYQVVREMVDKMGYKVDDETECVSFDLRPSDAINIAVRCKVPIQVNKFLAYSDGMKIVESAKPSLQGPATDGLIFKELDRPSGQPCVETKEFNLVRNMLIAAVEERYRDAGVFTSLLHYFIAPFLENKTF